jgi:hypothetical protein
MVFVMFSSERPDQQALPAPSNIFAEEVELEAQWLPSL